MQLEVQVKPQFFTIHPHSPTDTVVKLQRNAGMVAGMKDVTLSHPSPPTVIHGRPEVGVDRTDCDRKLTAAKVGHQAVSLLINLYPTLPIGFASISQMIAVAASLP